MRKFDDSFRTSLRDAVQEVETSSSVELVVAVLPRVQRYLHVPLLLGAALSVVTLTLLIFVEAEFHYIHIYIDTVAAFLAGAGLIWVFPSLGRMMIGRAEIARQVETKARAMFQKAGIHETRHRTGVLVVFCWLERQAVIVADRGVVHALPPAELEKLRQQAQQAIESRDSAEAILQFVKGSKTIFTDLLPQQADDINELPDELWLD
jgi:putative membrane protein